jgi:hypothetical protein
VAGFYSATRDRVMPPLRGLLSLRRVQSVANDKPSMTVIARKVALAFYLASREEKVGLIEDAGDGLRADLLKRLAARPPRGVE